VIDAFTFTSPSTKAMEALVERVGCTGRKVLVLTDGLKPNVHLSGRNLPKVHVMPYGEASTYHILWSDAVLIEAPAIGHTLAPIAETAPSAPAKRVAAKAAKGERAAKPEKAPKAAAKPAAKRAPAAKATEKKPAAKKPAKKKGD